MRGSREISLVPSLHRASTDALIGCFIPPNGDPEPVYTAYTYIYIYIYIGCFIPPNGDPEPVYTCKMKWF